MLNKVEIKRDVGDPYPVLSLSIHHFNEPVCSGKQKFTTLEYQIAMAQNTS